MSKGLGRVQRTILALIEAEPNGAWSFEELCGLIYPTSEWVRPKGAGRVRRPKAQLVAVGRALARMTLPGTWTTGGSSGDRRSWLYDKCSLVSERKRRPYHDKAHFEPGGYVFEQVEKAKRWRDGSPLERVGMEIERLQSQMGMLGMVLKDGGGDAASITADLREAYERIKELEKERASLLAH
jgi:hypothetical protein